MLEESSHAYCFMREAGDADGSRDDRCFIKVIDCVLLIVGLIFITTCHSITIKVKMSEILTSISISVWPFEQGKQSVTAWKTA